MACVARPDPRSFFFLFCDHPACTLRYGAEGTYGNAGGGGTYDNAQFSGGGNTGGYMDVAPSGPGAY